MSDYLLLEDDSKVLLEDSSGDVLLDTEPRHDGRAHDPPGPPHPRKFQARTSQSFGDTSKTPIKVSQLPVEIINSGTKEARVSQFTLEFITKNNTDTTYPFAGLYLAPLIVHVRS